MPLIRSYLPNSKYCDLQLLPRLGGTPLAAASIARSSSSTSGRRPWNCAAGSRNSTPIYIKENTANQTEFYPKLTEQADFKTEHDFLFSSEVCLTIARTRAQWEKKMPKMRDKVLCCLCTSTRHGVLFKWSIYSFWSTSSFSRRRRIFDPNLCPFAPSRAPFPLALHHKGHLQLSADAVDHTERQKAVRQRRRRRLIDSIRSLSCPTWALINMLLWHCTLASSATFTVSKWGYGPRC